MGTGTFCLAADISVPVPMCVTNNRTSYDTIETKEGIAYE